MDSRVSWLACAAIAAVLVWFAIWSGGGSDGGGGSVTPMPAATPPATTSVASDDPGIQQVISRVFTQADPKQCTNDMTHAFLQQRFGSSKGSLDRCRRTNVAADPGDEADTITVQSVTVTGPSAAAAFLANGGFYGGSVFTVRLAHQGGRWRLDSLTNVQIDRPTFDEHIKGALRQSGYLPAEQTCAIAKFDQSVSDDDIARNIVVGDSPTGVTQYAASCLSRPTLLRQLGELFTATLRSYGFSGPVVRCVVGRITHGVPTVRLRHLLAAGERGTDGWARLGYEAARECLGDGPGSGGGASTV